MNEQMFSLFKIINDGSNWSKLSSRTVKTFQFFISMAFKNTGATFFLFVTFFSNLLNFNVSIEIILIKNKLFYT